MTVVWHDLECGGYTEDLTLWLSLAADGGGPVLDVGAGTGRVALYLARHGHRVTALDHDRELLDELARRARGLDIKTIVADAREFELGERFPLCLVPMQTIQLLGGADGRQRFLRCARRHLLEGAVLAIALAEIVECYDAADGQLVLAPDVCELDGTVYASLPTAVRAEPAAFILERRRETLTRDGLREVLQDVIALDRVAAAELEQEGRAAGFEPAGRRLIAPSRDYAGSTVVMLRA
jgi:SAM-dependent methyltransferase